MKSKTVIDFPNAICPKRRDSKLFDPIYLDAS